jgi:hypothetical protein
MNEFISFGLLITAMRLYDDCHSIDSPRAAPISPFAYHFEGQKRTMVPSNSRSIGCACYRFAERQKTILENCRFLAPAKC